MIKPIPIILCGGAGVRLWPASRRDYPKPFMEVAGQSLLQHALARAHAIGADDVVIVANAAYHHIVEAHASAMPANEAVNEPANASVNLHYLCEPQGRNTAPAIALATQYVAALFGGQTPCLVMTADHLIDPLQNFADDVAVAIKAAQENALVVFGVPPAYAASGYGYIGVAQKDTGQDKEKKDLPQKVEKFVEKPDTATAQDYVQSGLYYWNSGMFCFCADVMCASLEALAGDVWESARATFASATTQNRITHFVAADFASQPDISIDYAVMERAVLEKTPDVMMVPTHFSWSDVGSWASVADAHAKDEFGNSIGGNTSDYIMRHATRNTHIELHHHSDKVVATLGLDDVVIIDTPDALLVAKRDQVQNVRAIVDNLRESDAFARAATQTPALVHRPWGTYTTLKSEAGYQVKRLSVYPDQQLSLQYHHHRAEHWVVVQGTARVQIGEEVFEVSAGDYRYIPLGEKHRLANIGQGELILIEVQCGDYLGEDDIVRLADDYGRD